MYDAYGKFPPDGLFQGNFWLMGSASSCTEVNATYYKRDHGSFIKKNLTSFGGKYCLIQPLMLPIANGTWEELVDENFPDKQMTGAGMGLLRELEGIPTQRSPPLLWPGEGIFGASGVRERSCLMAQALKRLLCMLGIMGSGSS